MKFKKAKASVFFCHIHLAMGWCSKDQVIIDLKTNTNPIRTYLHELLHLEHPTWSETRILKAERRIWKKMTHEEIFLLGKRLFSRKFERWEDDIG